MNTTNALTVEQRERQEAELMFDQMEKDALERQKHKTPIGERAINDPYPLFPAELKALDRWCVYKFMWNEEKQKHDKPPYNARTHKKGNPIDPADRSSFETAVAALGNQDYEGAGFGLAYSDGLTCTDFDHCITNGEIDPAIRKILEETHSYSEFSPSGDGIHIWTKGWQVPISEGTEGRKVGNAEMYSGGHYLTVTGKHVPETPQTIESCNLSRLYDRVVCGEFKQASALKVSAETSFKGPVGVERNGTFITTKLHILMAGKIDPGSTPFIVSDGCGNTVEYPSHSEADLALCTLLAREGGDAEKIDERFRESCLYREKWERRDYRDSTKAKAIESAQKLKAESNQTSLLVLALPTDLQAVEDIDENSEAAIPAFDPSVVNGMYSRFVELVTRGTTLVPQFAYAIAKTIIGARMAGKVKFENLDAEPRFYTALIGETGSGKGEAWRRCFQILQPEGALISCKIKIINSADSGAGIKDFFFQSPEDQPVLCYVDEIESLGNKSKDTRNPGILDTMIELADCTSISRVLAKRDGGGSKSKSDARFSMVMCGQDGLVYTKALAGRTKLGLWDRFTSEYGVPQETGDLPPVNLADAIQLLSELNSLDYSGTMSMALEAKAHLDAFWKGQPNDVRKKARWKKNLTLDAYMSAFGRGVRKVELEDVAIAIKIFTRQLVIRRVCFSTEVPDRVGYYLGLIKRITERMEHRLSNGVARDVVAKSRRDYERETNAHRDNETHIFERAWAVHAPVWLMKVEVKKPNGQTYVKYLPAPNDA